MNRFRIGSTLALGTAAVAFTLMPAQVRADGVDTEPIPDETVAATEVSGAEALVVVDTDAGTADALAPVTVPDEPVPAPTAASTEIAAPDCTITAAAVDAGHASFTVGPEGCEGQVGPLSFSAFELPGGYRTPFDAQVLIAHHLENGSTYSVGVHSLDLELGDACNWQTDLYFGSSAVPIFGEKLIAADYLEGEVCVEETTTTVEEESAGPTTTEVGDAGGEATTTTAAPTTAAPTTTEAASAGPTTQVSPSGATLPATGPADGPMLGMLAGGLIGMGTMARRLARR